MERQPGSATGLARRATGGGGFRPAECREVPVQMQILDKLSMVLWSIRASSGSVFRFCAFRA